MKNAIQVVSFLLLAQLASAHAADAAIPTNEPAAKSTQKEAPCNCQSTEKEAELLARLKQDQKLWGKNSNEVVRRLVMLARFYTRMEDLEKSDAKLNEALAISSRLKIQKYRSDALLQSAKNDMQRSHYKEAAATVSEALRFTRSNALKAELLAVLSRCQGELKQTDAAVTSMTQSLKLQTPNSANAEELASRMLQLSELHRQQGQIDKQRQQLKAATSLMSRLKGEKNPFTQYCRQMLQSVPAASATANSETKSGAPNPRTKASTKLSPDSPSSRP